MISTKGSIFYQDDYKIIYKIDWFSYNNSMDMEFNKITCDPNIPGMIGNIVLKDRILYKYGLISIERQIIRFNGTSGVFVDPDNTKFTVVRNRLEYNKFINSTCTVRNSYKDQNGADHSEVFKAKIVDIQDRYISQTATEQIITLDKRGRSGSGLLVFDGSYTILADHAPTYTTDYFQFSFPYSDHPVDKFKYHLDNQYMDFQSNVVSDGSGWSDLELNNTIWADVAGNGDTSVSPYNQALIFENIWGASNA